MEAAKVKVQIYTFLETPSSIVSVSYIFMTLLITISSIIICVVSNSRMNDTDFYWPTALEVGQICSSCGW